MSITAQALLGQAVKVTGLPRRTALGPPGEAAGDRLEYGYTREQVEAYLPIAHYLQRYAVPRGGKTPDRGLIATAQS